MTSKIGERDSFIPPLWILTLIAATGAVYLAIAIKELLILLVLGYFIAYAIDPLLHRLARYGISRPIGVFVVFGVVLAVLLLLALTAIPTILEQFDRLTDNLNHYVDIGKSKLDPLVQKALTYLHEPAAHDEWTNDILSNFPSLSEYVSGDTVKAIVRTLRDTLLRGYSLTLTIINVALLPFIVFYLAVDLPGLHRFFLALVPFSKRHKVESIFQEINIYVSSFVRGQFTVCTILFVLYAIGLGIVGVDLWLLLAAISGFGNIIPYVGFLTGILLSSLMAIVSFGDFSHLLWVWGVYASVQFLEGTFITPKILGESVGLSPLVIILALVIGGQLLGLLGVFLAVPMAAALRVLGQHSYQWVLKHQ